MEMGEHLRLQKKKKKSGPKELRKGRFRKKKRKNAVGREERVRRLVNPRNV